MPTYAVLLFAGLRERAGRETIEVDLAAGATAADLLAEIERSHPDWSDRLGACRVAAGQEFVDAGHVLNPGEEIALIPPVSGGHDWAVVRLSSEPLSLDAVVEAVRHHGAGGIVTFTGSVRGHSRDRDIVYLDYEAYAPMAVRSMRRIVGRIESLWPGTAVAIHHRVGRLFVGETAVLIAVSAPHRAEAFEACREAIEALKREVPIWKREVSTDGATWIGRGP
jgi:molybdopterin synthase catalytic subunit